MAAAPEIEVPLQDFQCDAIFSNERNVFHSAPRHSLGSTHESHLPDIDSIRFCVNDRDNKLYWSSNDCYNTHKLVALLNNKRGKI